MVTLHLLIDILKNGRMIIQRRLFSFLHVSVPMYVSHVSVSLGRQNILNIQSLFPHRKLSDGDDKTCIFV